MGVQVQYNLFESRIQSEERCLKEYIEELEASIGRIRRGQYAKLGALNKEVCEVKERLSILEKNICNDFLPKSTELVFNPK